VIGFFIGACVVVLAVVLLQQRVIHDVEGDIAYRFDHYVFSGADFPKGDFNQGRLVHRILFPSRASVTYYDAQFHEVTHADKPGRYGAVVRMNFGLGNTIYKYVTLYRTQAKVIQWDTTWPTQVPPEAGIDPAVLAAQASEIDNVLKTGFVGDGGGAPNLAILLAGLSETSPTDPPAVKRNDVMARDADWWYVLRQRIGRPIQYPYFVDLPSDYNADPAKRWPLILYLHAGVETGNDLKIVHVTGLPRVIKAGRPVPAVVLAPQCPNYEWWNPRALAQLLDEVAAKYRIDPDRVYITGGSGVWILALAYPERFAAINPISGASDPADAARLKDMPIWAFRNERDDNLPLGLMVDTLRKAGGHPHVTLVEDLNLDPWDVAYATDPLYAWLLAQKKGQPEVITPGVPSS